MQDVFVSVYKQVMRYNISKCFHSLLTAFILLNWCGKHLKTPPGKTICYSSYFLESEEKIRPSVTI